MNAVSSTAISDLGWDDRRGTASMWLLLVTEAMLFVSLFFAYFYFGRDQPRWPMDEPPKLKLALIMLVLLLISSGVVEWGRRQAALTNRGAARFAVVMTMIIGVVFVALQGMEYREHLQTLLPTTDAYGSIFYTITSIHGLHLVVGLLMLAYAAALPELSSGSKPPHRPLHNAALYWHFVDGMWVIIVALLYVLPHLQYGSGAR